MRYFLFVIAFASCAYAHAQEQVVVKPDARPIYIRIESAEPVAVPEVAAPKVQLDTKADRVAALEKELSDLKKELEFLRASKQVELFNIDEPDDAPAAYSAYPTRASRSNWNMGGIAMTNSNLIRHLMGEIGSPQHGGKFNRDYLNYLATLPDGNARLRALHSDDHNHTVRWSYVGGKPEAATVRVSAPASAPTYCPTGTCPLKRR